MSYTTSAMLSRSQSVVAIAGATGPLGTVITETFLTTFKPFFSRVVALTRDPSSSKAQALAALGAELVQVTFSEDDPEDAARLRYALRGIDIVVNALGRVDARAKDVLAEGAIEAGAKVYFPSEFGIDHRLSDFPGFEHEEWVRKRKHLSHVNELASEKGADMKVIAVYTGLFLDGALDPRSGLDFRSRSLTIVGPSSARVTYTSKADIARAVAQLAILAMHSPAALADSVPDHVRIAGCTRSAAELAEALGRLKGETFEVVEEDLDRAKEKLMEESEAGQVGSPSGYIRVLMGEGKLDFSKDNANELVDPHERLWRWETLEQAIGELKLQSLVTA